MRWLGLLLILLGLLVLAVGTAQACSVHHQRLSTLAAAEEVMVFNDGISLRAVLIQGGSEQEWTERYFPRLFSTVDEPVALVVGQVGLDSMCEGRRVVELYNWFGARLGSWDGIDGAIAADHLVYVPTEGDGLRRVALGDLEEETWEVALPDDRFDRDELRVALHPEQGAVLVDGAAGTWSWFDTSGQLLQEGLPTPGTHLLRPVFSPGGGQLAIAAPAPYDEQRGGWVDEVVVHVWGLPPEAAPQEWRLSHGGAAGRIIDLVWWNDALLVATSDRLWRVDPATGDAVERLGPEGGIPGGMAVSKYGPLVAWRGPDWGAGGVMLVFDAEARQAIWLGPDGQGKWAPKEAIQLHEGETVAATPGGPALPDPPRPPGTPPGSEEPSGPPPPDGPAQPEERATPGLLAAPTIALLAGLCALVRQHRGGRRGDG